MRSRLVLVLLFPLLGAAAPDQGGQDARQIVAQRGEVALTVGDVRDLIAHADPATRERLDRDPAALAEFIRTRVLQLSLLAEAKGKKWDEAPDVTQRIAQARDAVIVDTYLTSLATPDQAYPSEAEIETAYEANKPRFAIPRQYDIAQIFIAVPKDAPKQADEAAQKKARELRQLAGRAGANFADLARRESQDRSTADHGGDLGWVREDQLEPTIRATVAGLAEGGVSEPVRLPDGWHIVKLIGTRPASTAPLATVKDALVRALRQDKASQNARAYLAEMQRKEPVQVNEIGLAHAVVP